MHTRNCKSTVEQNITLKDTSNSRDTGKKPTQMYDPVILARIGSLLRTGNPERELELQLPREPIQKSTATSY